MKLKLKRTPGIYLVGFMCSGKSTIGPALADTLGWNFADLDHVIEEEEGRSIARIFAERGETAFRELETGMLHRYVDRVRRGVPYVIAAGGGAFVDAANRALLADHGVTVWLDCSLEVVRQRLGMNGATRPLAQDPAVLETLYQERRQLYALADLRIDTGGAEVAESVRKIAGLALC